MATPIVLENKSETSSIPSTATTPSQNPSERLAEEEINTQARVERHENVENPPLSKLETTASKRNIVKWDVDDPENPRNWKTLYKVWITFLLGMLALSASIGSSIISPAEDVIAEYTGVSHEV